MLLEMAVKTSAIRVSCRSVRRRWERGPSTIVSVENSRLEEKQKAKSEARNEGFEKPVLDDEIPPACPL